MDAKRIEEIRQIVNAMPGDNWQIRLGSGMHHCTAIFAFDEEENDAATIPICDCCTDWMLREYPQMPDHTPVMNFIEQAPANMRYLLAALDEARKENAELQELLDSVSSRLLNALKERRTCIREAE